MSASVLFDVPGPRTVRRHRLYGIASVVVLGALLAVVIAQLASKDQFAARYWESYQDPATWRSLRDGFVQTLLAAGAAITGALLLAAAMTALRMSGIRLLAWPANVIVEFFRAIPLVLLILFLFLGYGSTLGVYWSLVIGLVLYNGAVLAELFRAGIVTVPKGQSEAGYSLGLSRRQVLWIVLAPQALRAMLPAVIGQCVVALKDTALGFVIAYGEAASATKGIYVFYDNPLQAGVVTGALYITLNGTLSRIATVVEGRRRRDGRSTAAVLGQVQLPGGGMSQVP